MGRFKRVVVVGGAGFIGSHFTDRLLADGRVEEVTLFDNFSSGRGWHFQHHLADKRLKVVRGEVDDLDRLVAAMSGHDLVIHLASNPDIARAMTDPTIDFHQGTALTHCVVEAMRLASVPQILYASGSGVYGELGLAAPTEDHGPLLPVSTYGASKLAGEALICSYCYMFGMRGSAFRFANVVGPRQTHGVGFDFVRRLLQDGSRLSILGDGTQSKSYVHVDDIVSAVLHVGETSHDTFGAFNVGTDDYVTVTEIAEMAVRVVGLEPGSVRFEYAGGDRGWKGDVPIVRLDSSKIKSTGWRCERTSAQALTHAMESLLIDERAGRLT